MFPLKQQVSRFQGQGLGKVNIVNSNMPNYGLALTRFNRYQMPRVCLKSAKGNSILQIKLRDVFKTGLLLGTSYSLTLYSYNDGKQLHQTKVLRQVVLTKLKHQVIDHHNEDLVLAMKPGAYLIEVRPKSLPIIKFLTFKVQEMFLMISRLCQICSHFVKSDSVSTKGPNVTTFTAPNVTNSSDVLFWTTSI